MKKNVLFFNIRDTVVVIKDIYLLESKINNQHNLIPLIENNKLLL